MIEKAKMKECIKTLIEVRELCGETDCCEDCRFANEYHDCCFAGIPWHWDDLEELLKKESEEQL